MAGMTWEDKQNDIVQRNIDKVMGAGGQGNPALSVGPRVSPYSLVPGRNPNDPLDQAIRTGAANAGGAIMSDIRGNPRPLNNPGFDISGSSEGAIPMGDPAVGSHMYRAFHRLATAGRPEITPDQSLVFGGNRPAAAINTGAFPAAPGSSPSLQDFTRGAIGYPRFQNMEEGINRLAAIPDRQTAGAINPNSFGNRWESTTPLPNQAMNTGDFRDITLAANRSPMSRNPQNMGDYEFGGMFNGQPVYFYRGNPQDELVQNAREAIRTQQTQYGSPMTVAMGNLERAIQEGPNAESVRNLQSSQADYQRAHAGLIPSQIEENQARSDYYRRPQPFTMAPGTRAFLPQGSQQAIQIAEGAPEKPATANANEKMDEFDKQKWQAGMHLMTSLDPEMQKRGAALMDEVEAKNAPKGKQNLPSRDDAYARLKKTGKYTDDQINAKLNALYAQ